ncbi:MAG: hypothetical protein QW759_01385 [Candidatus Micrarchaeaceae archaeon]
MLELRKRAHGRIHVKTTTNGLKGQSAIDYLLTYSWALIIVALIMGIPFFLIYVPSIIVPSTCSFVSGAYCQDMVFGSNSVSSSVAIFLTNTQPYPVVNPSITLNISSVGAVQGTCRPSLVVAGGAIICNVTIPQRAIAYGTLESGKLYLSAVPCPSGNPAACSTLPKQTYLGSFNSHVEPLLSSISIVVSLAVANSTQAANGVPDKLTANVKMLGYPIAGATVTFKANQSFATIKPMPASTDSNGNAISYISSFTVGNVLVNASFAGVVSASKIVNFTEPIYVTFQVSPMPGASTAVVSIDNSQYLYNQLPVTFSYTRNSVHAYAFISPVSGAVNTRYVYSSISGCGLTAQSGSLIATKNCTVTANYETQYFLSMQAAPPTANIQLIPGSEWLYSGSPVVISVVAPHGYKFKKWVGTGSINYTGTDTTASVIMNTPISETAYVEKTTTTTSTSTTTSTTSSTLTISSTSTTTIAVYVASFISSQVTKLSSSGAIIGTYSAGFSPIGIAIDPSGNVWVTGSLGDVTKLSSSGAIIGTYSVGSEPQGIAIDPRSGNVWVADYGSDQVTELSSSGAIIGTYSIGGAGPPWVPTAPYGIAIDPRSGNVWVTDYGTNQVTELSSSGAIIGTYSVGGGPTGIAIDPRSGNVWVVNSNSGTVTELSSSGAIIGTYSVGGGPYGIAIDPSGNVWVTDTYGRQVTKLSSSGAIIGTYSVGGGPYGIAISP